MTHEHDYGTAEDETPTFEELDELRDEIVNLKAENDALLEIIHTLRGKLTQARQIIGFGDSRDDPEYAQ